MAMFYFLEGHRADEHLISNFEGMNSAQPNIKSMAPLFIVADLEYSLNFYTRNLGFDIDFRYEDFYAGITRNGCNIHLKAGVPAITERAGRLENGHIDVTFTVGNIDSLFEAVKALPLTIIQPLRHMPYGVEFYIVDPDGYILAFLE